MNDAVGFDLGVDDHVAGSMALYGTLPWLQRRIERMRWLLPGFILALVAVHAFLQGSGAVLLDTPMLLLAAVWAVGAPWLYRRSLRRNARLHYQGPGAASLLGWHEVTVDPEGIRITSTAAEMKLRWPHVSTVLVEDRHIVVAAGSVRVIVVPRRAFSDDASFARFVETCRTLQSSSESEGFAPPPQD